MGRFTGIEWADSTCNPMVGCLGCELWDAAGKTRTCYAGHLVTRYAGQKGWPKAFELPELYPNRLFEALRWPDLTGTEREGRPWMSGLPRVVFFCDLGDAFTEGLHEDWLADYLPVMAEAPFTWLLLTKRPKRAAQFFDRHPCPENFRLGTSVTDAATARLRIPDLRAAKVPGRFLSAEPWLGPGGFWLVWLEGIEWVIVGGESQQAGEAGKARKSDLGHIESAVLSAKEAGCAVFVKQLGDNVVEDDGAPLKLSTRKGGEWNEWPPHLRVRQMPASFRDR